jgi:hypothetical protein
MRRKVSILLFIEKTTKRIVELPDHFVNAWVARNYEPYIEEVEEEKVVLEYEANSQTRAGRKAKTVEDVEEN